MTAELMVEGSREKVTVDRQCDEVHAAWDAYEDAEPWVEDSDWRDEDDDYAYVEIPWIYGLDFYEVLSLDRFMSRDPRFPTVLSSDNIHFCTEFHEDGWLAADAGTLELVQGEHNFIVVTSEGPRECEFGQVLMSSAGYYYSHAQDAWDYWYGTDWVESFGYGFVVSGTIDFRCMEIFDPGAPPLVVEDEVPSTQVSINPRNRGLTGLDMWMWYDFSAPESHQLGPVDISVDARGQTWTLTAEAWVDKVMWDIDCTSMCDYRGPVAGFDAGGYEYVADFADTPRRAAPAYEAGEEGDDLGAFEHVYEELGDRTVSTATVWRGAYTFNGIAVEYDPVVVAGSWTFPVVSIRTELIRD